MSSLGEKLRKHRKDKGYSLEQLAQKVGASKSYLWELENRPIRKPSAEKLTTVAQELGVTIEYLLNDKADFSDAVTHEAFFRKYSTLDKDTQKKISDIVDAWSTED